MSSTEVANHRNTTEIAILAAALILLLTCYVYGYPAFKNSGISIQFLDKLIIKAISSVGALEKSDFILKAITIYFSFMYSVGSIGKKELKAEEKGKFIFFMVAGLTVYLASFFVFRTNYGLINNSYLYILFSIVSFLYFNIGFNRLYQLYKLRKHLGKMDKFNDDEEEFDQVDHKVGDEDYSIYIPATNNNETKRHWWNFVNPFAGNMITGNPGTGKSFVFINEFIRQTMLNGFTMCIYDYKRGELTDLAYRYLIMNKKQVLAHPNFKDVKPRFNVFDFDNPKGSVRINPLAANLLTDPADCKDMATVFMHNINRSWIEKRGDFFPESAINLVACLILFLRYTTLKSKEENGELAKEGNCCSLPHVISLLNCKRNDLFGVLANHPSTRIQFSAFADAVNDGAGEQLSGQTATTKISLAQFATPKVYWAMSGNDCSTFVSDRNNPQYLCLVNNEQRRETYGAAISMIMGQVVKKINTPGNLPSLLAIDELATVYVKDIDLLIATARSNRVAVLLGFQDLAQLIKDYGKKVADVVVNTVGNFASGRVMRETAKDLAEAFGKGLQRRRSTSFSNSGTSFSESQQMDYLIPASKISTLSQGEFVLRLSDTMEHRLDLKFARGIADMKSLGNLRLENRSNSKFQNLKRQNFKEEEFLNEDGKDISEKIMQDNFDQIESEVRELLEQEIEALGIIIPQS
ncbi:MAG: TraM recognition domain-containing protein [Daejeonella sp.]